MSSLAALANSIIGENALGKDRKQMQPERLQEALLQPFRLPLFF